MMLVVITDHFPANVLLICFVSKPASFLQILVPGHFPDCPREEQAACASKAETLSWRAIFIFGFWGWRRVLAEYVNEEVLPSHTWHNTLPVVQNTQIESQLFYM